MAKPSADTLLIEIGTEELPPVSLQALGHVFAESVANLCAEENLEFASYQALYSPRRLAVQIKDLPAQQADYPVSRKGPKITAAYDAEGNPSKAALGFAKSCGKDISELIEQDGHLYFSQMTKGKTIDELLANILEKALKQLPIPRPMRWGDKSTRFIRPVHWLVCMHGERVIDLGQDILGQPSSNHTQGHRFHSEEKVILSHASDYIEALKNAYVLVDPIIRKQEIVAQLQNIAAEIGGYIDFDEDLLDEVTNLVEWPVAVVGNFDARFLEIPHEVLVKSMQGDQRYFPIYSDKNKSQLRPHFVTISNIQSKQPEVVRNGNERVIKPRFEDAEFFWKRDLATPLAERIDGLKDLVFEKELGSVLDKTQRIETIAAYLAEIISADIAIARRAAHLCKCDLLSSMVFEFPELQGIMGRYYALNDQENTQTAAAIEEHYWPKHAGGCLPTSAVGNMIALADRLDTLVGIFAIGKKPSGEKDPYGLRRAALGIVRISIENKIDFDLYATLEHTAAQFPEPLNAKAVIDDVFSFIVERMRAYFAEQGIPSDTFESVVQIRPSSLHDFKQRIAAVQGFRSDRAAVSLSAANKRIRNILMKSKIEDTQAVDVALLQEPAEQSLHQQLNTIAGQVEPMFQAKDYSQSLATLAQLREPIDTFFDQVMVMAEDEAIKTNRIALIAQTHQLFSTVADLSYLQADS